jgi:hypothetical protein
LLFILWVGRIEGEKKLVSAIEWACASWQTSRHESLATAFWHNSSILFLRLKI